MDVSYIRIFFALTISALIAYKGFRKNSLSIDGAIAAFMVGVCHCIVGYSPFVLLLVFFLSSSRLTKCKSHYKKKVEADYKEGGQRNWIQVVSNGGWGSIICIYYYLHYGVDEYPLDYSQYWEQTFLIMALFSHYATCNGDTWASELGILSQTEPRLITTMKTVPKGTNGGVSLLGITASILGGIVVSVGFILVHIIKLLYSYYIDSDKYYIGSDSTSNVDFFLKIFFVGLFSGFFGSMVCIISPIHALSSRVKFVPTLSLKVDSFLGATLQYSGYNTKTKRVTNTPPYGNEKKYIRRISGVDVLSNELVNLLSSIMTSIVVSVVASTLLFA